MIFSCIFCGEILVVGHFLPMILDEVIIMMFLIREKRKKEGWLVRNPLTMPRCLLPNIFLHLG